MRSGSYISAIYILLQFLPSLVLSCHRCPACSNSPPKLSRPTLEPTQMQRLYEMFPLIRKLESLPHLLKNTTYQKPMVNLTDEQREQILDYYGEFFMSASALPQTSLSPSSSVSSLNEASSGRSRRKRTPSTGVRVCPADQSYQAIYLSLDADGQLVQVAQFPDIGEYQWFIQETCQEDFSLVVDVNCVVVPRLVSAYVIDLTTGDTNVNWIRTDCCVGHFNG